jgi:negative regulator of sigma E activity
MAGRVALAAAASVATIGVVSWIGTQGGAPGVSSTPIVAKGAPARAIQPVEFTKPASQPNVQDYLTAHRQIPSADAYRPVSNQQGAAAAR